MSTLIAIWNAAWKAEPVLRPLLLELVKALSARDDGYSRARRILEELAHEQATEATLYRMGKL